MNFTPPELKQQKLWCWTEMQLGTDCLCCCLDQTPARINTRECVCVRECEHDVRVPTHTSSSRPRTQAHMLYIKHPHTHSHALTRPRTPTHASKQANTPPTRTCPPCWSRTHITSPHTHARAHASTHATTHFLLPLLVDEDTEHANRDKHHARLQHLQWCGAVRCGVVR